MPISIVPGCIPGHSDERDHAEVRPEQGAGAGAGGDWTDTAGGVCSQGPEVTYGPNRPGARKICQSVLIILTLSLK